MQTIRVAPLICQVLKGTMGLARIERANPLLVQALDVVGAFATATVSPFLHLIPWRQHPQFGWSKSAVHPARRRC
jgi:hypothetical protein